VDQEVSVLRTRRIARALPTRLVAFLIIASLLTLSLPGLAQATPAIDKAKAQAQALLDLIDQLDEELSAAAEDYDYAAQMLEETQAKVKKIQSSIAKAEADLKTAQDLLNKRLVNIYKAGTLSMLNVLLGSSSFSEMISRADQWQRLGNQDSQLIDDVQNYRQDVSDRKVQLESELKQQQDEAGKADVAKANVLTQLEKQDKALKGKEKQIAQLRKAEAARQAKLAAQAKARQKFLASRPGIVINTAMKYLEVPYVWGGASTRGFDCSGLVLYCYAKVGITLPHSSRMQYNYGRRVSRSELKPGDLVFFYNPIHHVGIYIGNGNMINATGTHVQIGTVWKGSYYGATRLL
jgi:cell wall-associated NlpC family hydrolase/flagellar hook-basal body complex protein FliE